MRRAKARGIGGPLAASVALAGLGLLAHASVVRADRPTAVAADRGPTVVWYSAIPVSAGGGSGSSQGLIVYSPGLWLLRAWSDGRVEGRFVRREGAMGIACDGTAPPCTTPWVTLSTTAEGLPAIADLNGDERVDGIDLSTVLSEWGPAPRVPFPPSDCPLDLLAP